MLASLFLFLYCRKEQLPLNLKKGLFMFVFFYFLAFVGGRIFSFWETALAKNTAMYWGIFELRPAAGKLRWYGSMLFFIISLPVFLSFFKPQLRWKYFDAFALAVCLFIVFIKQGCQLAGDGCYGIPTTLPWGMYYADGIKPSLIPVHPTPIYDSLFHVFLLIFLLKIRNKLSYAGQLGFLFFSLSSIFCFFLEFIRRNPDAAWGLTLAQWTYMAVLFVTLGCWAWKHKFLVFHIPFLPLLTFKK